MYYEIFAKLCYESGVKPADVSKATGISTATLSSWKKFSDKANSAFGKLFE